MIRVMSDTDEIECDYLTLSARSLLGPASLQSKRDATQGVYPGLEKRKTKTSDFSFRPAVV
jgi:hypothetical protein